MDNKDLKQQTGLWIDNTVLYSDLKLLDKLILADIIVLSRGKNQFLKTNQTLANWLNVSLRSVNYSMLNLRKRGLIVSKIIGMSAENKKKRLIIPIHIEIAKL